MNDNKFKKSLSKESKQIDKEQLNEQARKLSGRRVPNVGKVEKRIKLSLMLRQSVHMKLKAHCTLEDKTIQDYLIDLIERDMDRVPDFF